MEYEDLIAYMHEFRMGRITRNKMVAAIHLWQRGYYGQS